MKRSGLSFVLAAVWPALLLADSAVVFNEIMYHPAGTNEAALEWVELHNQHAVDIDLTRWRLDAGIDFNFPTGTVIRAGGYLVVASSPTNLGVANVLGPFRNRLSNAGDRLVLRNNSGRIIDEVEYGAEIDWPVAPDGGGPSLARRARNLPSREPASWRASFEMGGSPGRVNSPVNPAPALAFNEFSSSTNADFWIEVINAGITNVNLGGFVLARYGGATNREYVLPAGIIAPGGFRELTKIDLGFAADSGDRLVLYTPGKSNVVDAIVAKKEPRGRHPDGNGPWLFPQAPTPGASNYFALHVDLVINEIFYNGPPMHAQPALFTSDPFITLTNEWRWFATGAEPDGSWPSPGYDDSGWNVGRGVFHAPAALNLAVPKGTLLPLTNELGQRVVTFYFRTEFNFSGATNDLALTLIPVVDDGAVFYLNGVEVHRMNLPGTNIQYGTLALTNVGLPSAGAPVTLLAPIVQGVNTLAVEVHQVIPNSSDVGFACHLAATRLLSPAQPYRESTESWIELHNRGSAAVNLHGWRLDEGIDFRFNSNTTINAGGYLVVAKDVALILSNYPGIAVVGPFTNGLSRNSDLISLKDPNNNPADEVRYYSGGRWPEYADAGGSSLELRDARADNNTPDAWAASDETVCGEWRTYTYRGICEPGQAGEPTLWHEFALCLLDGAGEILLDDISVIETPATAPKELIQNGTFVGGSAARWRFLGNHRHSRVEADPDVPGNYVLRLVSTGAGEYQGNQIETTLTNNVAVINGREYEISFRAKWVAGKSRLNSRLYFNRLARTVSLELPAQHGTPGARNSRFTTNAGPTFSNLAHSPVVPTPTQPVTISVHCSDPDGLSGLTLRYAVNGGAWQNVAMVPALSNRFTGLIPAQSAATIVQFHVAATDNLGAMAYAPARGTNSRALYVVQDNRGTTAGAQNFRLVMTVADAAFMHTSTNTLSNELLGSTVIYNESEFFYDVGVRLKGSFVGRNVPRVGFHLQFLDDQLFRGDHRIVSVDRSQHTTVGSIGEIITKHVANRAGDIPSMYDDVARFIHQGAPSYTSMSTLRLTGFDGAWLDAQFENGGDGPMFEVETLRWMLGTIDGHPESPKQVGNESGGTGFANLEAQDWGDNHENYRWWMLQSNNRTEDTFDMAVAWSKTLGLTGTNFEAQVMQVLDVDQWLRVLAFQSLVGPADAYYTGGNIHNFRIYVRPEDNKVLYLPWDWDSSFQRSATASLLGGGNVSKLLQNPHHRREYLSHMSDMVRHVYNVSYLSRWTTHYGAVGQQDLSSILNYVSSRASYVTSQLPNAAFAITNNAGANFTVGDGYAVLGGTSPLTVDAIVVNGTAYEPTWLSDTAWRITVPLFAGANSLSIAAVDRYGALVPATSRSMLVTNTGPATIQPILVNEWMADNAAPSGIADPADGLFQDWFELFNPNSVAVDLGGLYLTDNFNIPTKWRIPTNTFISGGGFILVWADNNAEQNGTGGGTNVDLHANFSLNNGGEAIGIFARDGATPIHTVSFGVQIENVSQGFFTDGNTNAMHFMTNFTPRLPNSIAGSAIIASASVSGAGILLSWNAWPGRTYVIEVTDDLASEWTLLSEEVTATTIKATFTHAAPPAMHRFYRIRLK